MKYILHTGGIAVFCFFFFFYIAFHMFKDQKIVYPIAEPDALYNTRPRVSLWIQTKITVGLG